MLFAYCKEQCRRSKAKTNVRWTEGKQKRYCEQGVSRCHGILVVHPKGFAYCKAVPSKQSED